MSEETLEVDRVLLPYFGSEDENYQNSEDESYLHHEDVSMDDVNDAYRDAVKDLHPDGGGHQDAFIRLQNAKEQLENQMMSGQSYQLAPEIDRVHSSEQEAQQDADYVAGDDGFMQDLNEYMQQVQQEVDRVEAETQQMVDSFAGEEMDIMDDIAEGEVDPEEVDIRDLA